MYIVEMQKGLTTSHLYSHLEHFAIKLIILTYFCWFGKHYIELYSEYVLFPLTRHIKVFDLGAK